jgi:hypothetical protein
MVQSISSERTIALPEYTGIVPGLAWPLVWIPKDPADALMDYSLSIGGWLSEIEDTASTITATWSPADGSLLINTVYVNNNIATIIVSGGLPYITYTVALNVVSQINAITLNRLVLLPVMPLYSDPGFPMSSASVSGVFQP